MRNSFNNDIEDINKITLKKEFTIYGLYSTKELILEQTFIKKKSLLYVPKDSEGIFRLKKEEIHLSKPH